LRRFGSQVLPDYMLPNHLVWQQSLPLTANGKLDRGALPWSDPDGKLGVAEEAETGSLVDEAEILELAREVLQVSTLERGTNFFDVGATSLTLIRLVEEIQSVFKQKIPVEPLLKSPTVLTIGELLCCPENETAQRAGDKAEGNTQPHGQRAMSLSEFSGWLGLLQALEVDGESKYLYPSGGGKYAVQTYLYLKPGSVQGLEGGAYYYHPVEHSLHRLSTA